MGNIIRKHVHFVFIICLVACNNSSKENYLHTDKTVSVKDDSIPIINTFFSIYEKNHKIALDTLLASNGYIDGNSAEIIEMKMQLDNLVSQLGKYYGYDLITKNTVSSNYLLYSYIVYYQRQPVRFNIIVYKLPDEEWKVQNFQFDVNLINELNQSSQVYFLNKTFQYSN